MNHVDFLLGLLSGLPRWLIVDLWGSRRGPAVADRFESWLRRQFQHWRQRLFPRRVVYTLMPAGQWSMKVIGLGRRQQPVRGGSHDSSDPA